MFSDVFAIWCGEMIAGLGALLVLVYMDRRATRGREQTIQTTSELGAEPHSPGKGNDDELRLEQAAAIIEVERLLRSAAHPSKES